jgi:hypothetical protein
MRTAYVTLFYTFFFFFFFFFSSSSSSLFSFRLIVLLIHVADFTDVSEMEFTVSETRLVWQKYPLSIFRFV